LITSPKTHSRINFFFKPKIWILKLTIFFKTLLKEIVDADGLFYVCKMMETHHKKTFNYIINIYFKILKTLNKVDDEFKD
jgi:hypothetical protein